MELLRLALVLSVLCRPTATTAQDLFCPQRCTCDQGWPGQGSAATVNCSRLNLTDIPTGIDNSTADVLFLNLNQLTHLDLEFLRNFPRLRELYLGQNSIRSLAQSSRHYKPFFGLTNLDLSQNSLHVLHPFVLTGFPNLRVLNLSSNVIHTVAPTAFNLPSLTTLIISNNNLEELSDHLFDTSPKLAAVDLSRNRLSRLNDGTFGLIARLDSLDLSQNQLMRLEDNVLVGMEIKFLDLGYNSLRRVPHLPLRKLTSVQTLILDGNLFVTLETGSLREVRAEFLSISHCAHLQRLDKDAISSMTVLQTLTINNNPQLTYVHPGAITNAPLLAALDLSGNRLFALESGLVTILPSLRGLFLSGNSFKCHCSLSWIGVLGSNKTSSTKIEDLDRVVCRPGGQESPEAAAAVAIQQMDKLKSECEPYILPLFPASQSEVMGRNVSWLCKALGSGDLALMWRLPKKGAIVGNGECIERACVVDNVLTVMYLHPSDAGRYGCVAKNKFGQDQKQLLLDVKSEHIQIFPITVASTFVTLSWNTSGAVSTGRGYILQVKLQHFQQQQQEEENEEEVVVKQYEDIDVGLKMNSYTVNGLLPGHTYLFQLCLRKERYVMVVSSATLTTKGIDFQSELGIETDYVSVFAVSVILVGLVSACVCVSSVRLARLHKNYYRKKSGGGGGSGDTSSQREMIVSPSDLSSVNNQAFSSWQQPLSLSSSSSSSVVATGDQSRLVDNEVTSPMLEEAETRA